MTDHQTLEELRAQGIEPGDTIEVTIKTTRRGVLVESRLEAGGAAIKTGEGGVWRIGEGSDVELVQIAQPELVEGEKYLGGHDTVYVYKNGALVPALRGGNPIIGYPIRPAQAGRLKHVRIQVVDS